MYLHRTCTEIYELLFIYFVCLNLKNTLWIISENIVTEIFTSLNQVIKLSIQMLRHIYIFFNIFEKIGKKAVKNSYRYLLLSYFPCINVSKHC